MHMVAENPPGLWIANGKSKFEATWRETLKYQREKNCRAFHFFTEKQNLAG